MSEQPAPRDAPAPRKSGGPEQDHWLRRPSTIRRLWIFGIMVLIIVALMDLKVDNHIFIGFYSLYGFGACVAMVLIAKGLGILLKRKDTYYDD